MKATNESPDTLCSFCRKPYFAVGPLVEGPDNVYICGECADLCQSIVRQEKRRRGVTPSGPLPTDSQRMRAILDRLIPGQETAKAILSAAATCRLEGNGRILLVSPSQCSAKLLAKAVAFALDVPFAAGDSSGFGKTGSGNLFFDLLTAADFDVESAQRGVVFVGKMEVSAAQDAVLRLWHENVGNPVSGLRLNIGSLLFVCGASFVGLVEATRRLGRHPDESITPESLKEHGARPEWTASLVAVAHVPPFDDEGLTRVVDRMEFRHGS